MSETPISQAFSRFSDANSGLVDWTQSPYFRFSRKSKGSKGLENHGKSSSLAGVPPAVFGSVAKPPRKRKNDELRSREWLTDDEVEKLMKAAGDNRHGHRDATMILVAFRHGLRAAELVSLRWDAIDFHHSVMTVNRRKKGSTGTHPLTGRELRALRRLEREQEPESPFVFTSERGAPFATGGFRTMIARLGDATRCFNFRVHPQRCDMLVATSWPIKASIRAACRRISVTRTSSIPCATPS